MHVCTALLRVVCVCTSGGLRAVFVRPAHASFALLLVLAGPDCVFSVAAAGTLRRKENTMASSAARMLVTGAKWSLALGVAAWAAEEALYDGTLRGLRLWLQLCGSGTDQQLRACACLLYTSDAADE